MVRCDSPDVIKEFVRHGAGVGFLYLNSIKRGIEQGYFKVIQVPGLDLIGQSYIVYPKDKPLSSLAREFLAFLRASVAKNAPTKEDVPTTMVMAQNRKENGNGRWRHNILPAKLLSWIISITSLDWMYWVLA